MAGNLKYIINEDETSHFIAAKTKADFTELK